MVVVPSLTLCLVDGRERSEYTENTKNVDNRDGIRLEIKGLKTRMSSKLKPDLMKAPSWKSRP